MKYFNILTMMLGAGLLLSCTKHLSSPESDFEIEGSQPFHVTLTPDAVSPDTRTVNDGMSIRWEDKDCISLYYSETGKEVAFTNTRPFYVQDTRTGRFDGSLNGELEKGKHYDWYAIYPWNNYFFNSKTISGRTVSPASQVQNGNDNRANLAGKDCILFGRVNDVPDAEYPVIRMKPIVAALDCKVTNATGESIKVNQILVRASRPFHGKEAGFDITQPDAKFTPNAEKTLCTELKVENATDFATGTSAHFYIKVIPQTYAVGDKIAVKVVTDKSSQIFEKLLEKNLVFEAGAIKRFNLNITGTPQPPLVATKPDWETLHGINKPYGRQKDLTFDGWYVDNGNIITNRENNRVKPGEYGVTLFGKDKTTEQAGFIKSPLLGGGCGTVQFKFFQAFHDIDFIVRFKDKSGNLLPGKEFTVNETAMANDSSTHSADFIRQVDISGEFFIEIQQKAGNETNNRGPELLIHDFTWTPFAG